MRRPLHCVDVTDGRCTDGPSTLPNHQTKKKQRSVAGVLSHFRPDFGASDWRLSDQITPVACARGRGVGSSLAMEIFNPSTTVPFATNSTVPAASSAAASTWRIFRVFRIASCWRSANSSRSPISSETTREFLASRRSQASRCRSRAIPWRRRMPRSTTCGLYVSKVPRCSFPERPRHHLVADDCQLRICRSEVRERQRAARKLMTIIDRGTGTSPGRYRRRHTSKDRRRPHPTSNCCR